MPGKNNVFIATSIDGYIADKNGEIDWLDAIPGLKDIDTGYDAFMSEIDALVMGRVTFETVNGFDMDWPYQKPVFVLSTTMTQIPVELKGKVQLVKGTLENIVKKIHQEGYHNLYIDGGNLIQSFLRADLIDEMIITVIPILLGGGHPLFGKLTTRLDFECQETKLFLNSVVQNHYVRRHD